MLQKRSPIVVILGHVDHGKTTLLDYLRKSDLAAHEAGGITQSIRSFQTHNTTFIDTPGHAAFSGMRSRGSLIADLAVLIVAADDGVMPQTRQSAEFIKSAGIPFVVAITKSDLATANPDKVKTQLTEIGIVVEDFGGSVPVVSVSAKTGQGIPELLELLELLASLNPPQADPYGALEARVLESHLDSKKGPLASVIVKNGTLRVGDSLPLGKIRSLTASTGESLKSAPPSTPVEVMGLTSVPEVGSDIAKPSSSESNKETAAQVIEAELKIVLRTDVAGSLEAILASLPREVTVISSGTGDFTETDVATAKTAVAVLVGFNVKASASVTKLAEVEHVAIYYFKIIYELLDRITELQVSPVVEKILGKAQVLAEFKYNNDRVAGCKCLEGLISKSTAVHIERAGTVVGSGRIKSLKIGKVEAVSVKAGVEFGMVLTGFVDFKIGDVIISYNV